MMKAEEMFTQFRQNARDEASEDIEKANEAAARMKEQLAEVRKLHSEAEEKLKKLERDASEKSQALEASQKALAEQDDECAAAVSEATRAVAKARDDRFNEFLIISGISAVSLFAGMYIQRKWDIRIPWISGVGVVAVIAGIRIPMSDNYRRTCLGGGVGLTLAGGVVFAMDYFPALKKH